MLAARHHCLWVRRLLGFALVVGMVVAGVPAAVADSDEGGLSFSGLTPREIGPVNMSGRVSDVEGVPGDPRILYVGAASGGIWKSTDGGLRFTPIFDDEGIASIGDLALAPSNPEVIYAGTGESNVRNSVSFGKGVWKSTDGGESWTFLGLEETRHISRIIVHPTDPDTAWVGALGHIFGPNPERGVYKTTDGGATWERVLFLDEHHGVADLDVDPNNPNILFATLWRFERKPWTMRSGSKEGGVWRSRDGGTTWERLTEGLPEEMGRIGVKVAPSDPRVVYVIAESNDGILFRSNDRGDTFEQVSDDVQLVSRGFYYTDLRVDPTNADRVYAVASRFFRSIDGGKTFERLARSVHIDFHSLWIDPLNPRRLWVGQDGGVAESVDDGLTWRAPRSLPLAQFYQAFYDERAPFYALGGGLQDNGTWYGPSRTREPGGILPDRWQMMSFGDAYFVVPHPETVDLFISESQAGGILRTDMRTRQQIDISPQPRRNDGGPAGELDVRFNWNAPIIASPHDPLKVYFAGNVVFESLDFGDTWRAISPDLTTNDPEKLVTAGGPVWPENTTAEYHCTIISFAESPVEPGLLWVGTDDGNLHLSRDGGETWSNLIESVPGVPAFSPVSHLEPSRTDAAVAYASFDRHMFNDLGSHLFKTTDYGASWRRIGSGLPDLGWLWVVREDPRNPEVVYAGTEVGLYVSFDAGENFQALDLEGLPPASVHDVLIHPRDNDLIVGTHGRGLWVFDDLTPIQQATSATAGDEPAAHLFPVRDALRFRRMFTRYGLGDAVWVAPNPDYGALISYHLPESLEPEAADEADESAEDDTSATESDDESGEGDASDEERLILEILDAEGQLLRTLERESLGLTAGFHRVAWNLAMDPPRKRTGEAPQGDFGSPPRGPEVLPGTYTVRLTVDGVVSEQTVTVGVDPLISIPTGALEAQQRMALALRDLRSASNGVLRGIDGLEAQLTSRRAEADQAEIELSEELETRWKAFTEALETQRERFERSPTKPRWSQGPRLGDLLAALFNRVDSAFAAPTSAQEALFEELYGETREAVTDWTRFLGDDAAQLSEALGEAGLPGLLIPDVVSLTPRDSAP